MWAFLLAAMAALSAPSASASPAGDAVQGFDAQIPYRPAPARIGDGRHLVYELHLTNFAATPLTIESIAVRDAATGAILLDLADEALAAAVGHVPSGGGATIAPGARAVAYLDIALAADARPAALAHRVTFASESGPATTIDAPTVAIDGQPLPVIGPPLRGGPWVAVYAPELERGHRRVVYAVAGKATIPGRFAVDWMKVDAEGRLDRSDGKALADSLSYGAEVLAVADAVVAATRDEFSEPELRADLPKVATGDATGNFIALDLGGGRYAFYEHLQPGLPVKAGDRVRRGQLIGRLGLTGQGSAPHLHFHVASAPSPLAAEGLPFLIEDAAVMGRYASINDLGSGPWQAAPPLAPGPALPEANAVVRFPE